MTTPNTGSPSDSQAFADLFREVLSLAGLDDTQKRSVEENLGKAVLLNAFRRLDERMSPEQRKAIFEQSRTEEEVISLCHDHFTREQLREILTDALEEVMRKFAANL